MNTTEFIEKATNIHNGFYSYDKTHYTKAMSKVIITCPLHGDFKQTPNNHINNKQKCPDCRPNKKMTTEKFIEKAQKIHGNFYDYSKVVYSNSKEKVLIICPKHGNFFQQPCHHISGKKCRKCGTESSANTRKDTIIDFIDKSNKTHNNQYLYTNVSYKKSTDKVDIICKIHGIFSQTPAAHVSGQGCPSCVNTQRSIGVKNIYDYLNINDIQFVMEKRFNDCRHVKPLPFDFYIETLNTCIEYDGEQHYRPISKWGGEPAYILCRNRDSIKEKFCKEVGIRLIRIRYDENPIDILIKNGII